MYRQTEAPNGTIWLWCSISYSLNSYKFQKTFKNNDYIDKKKELEQLGNESMNHLIYPLE